MNQIANILKSVGKAIHTSDGLIEGRIEPDLVLQDLYQWLEHGDYEKEVFDEREPGLHASSLWETCPRRSALRKKFGSKRLPIALGSRLTWDLGHAMHFWWQNRYLGPLGVLWGNWLCARCKAVTVTGFMPRRCPRCDGYWRHVLTYDETRVENKDLKYVGSVDGLLMPNPKLPRKVIWEFKSISNYQYKDLREPLIKHVYQVHSYMAALGIWEAWIFYQDKGSQCNWSKKNGRFKAGKPHIKAYSVEFNDKLWLPLTERVRDYHRVNEQLEDAMLDIDEFILAQTRHCSSPKAMMATECAYVDECFGTPAP